MLMLFVITQMDRSCAPANLDTPETDGIVQVQSTMLHTLRFFTITYTRTSFYLLNIIFGEKICTLGNFILICVRERVVAIILIEVRPLLMTK